MPARDPSTGRSMKGGGTLGEATVGLGIDATNAERGAVQAATAMETLTKKAEAVGKTFNTMGNKLMLGGTALAGFYVGALKSAMDFEKGLAGVRTMMGETNDNEVRQLGIGIQDLSVKFGQDITSATKAAYDALSASVPKDNILSFLDEAGKLAIAGVTDVSTTVDVLTSVVNSYGEKLAEYGDYTDRARAVSDMLFQTVVAGKTTMTELAPAMGLVAAVAASAGIAIKELGAMFATTTAMGTGTAESATALKAVMMGLLKPTDQTTQEFERLNINLKGFQEGEITLAELFQQVSKATGGSTQALAKLWAEKTAVVAITQILSGEMGAFNEKLEGQKNNLDATNKAYEVNAQTLSQKWATAVQSAKTLYRELGMAVTGTGDTLTKAAEWFQDMTTYIRENGDEVGKWMERIKNVTIAMLALGAAFKISAAVMGLAKAFQFLSMVTTTQLLPALEALKLWWIASPGWTLAAAASVAFMVKQLYDLYKEYQKLQEAERNLAATHRELNSATDEYQKKLVSTGQLTQQQVDSINKIADAEERNRRTREVVMLNTIKEQRHFTEEMVAAEEERVGRALSVEERYQLAVKTQRTTGFAYHISQVQQTAEKLLTTNETYIGMLADAAGLEKKEYDKKKEYVKNYAVETQLRYSEIMQYINYKLAAQNQEMATEEEVAAAREVAAQAEISILDALLLLRRNYTSQQIQQMNLLQAKKQELSDAEKASADAEAFDIEELRKKFQQYYDEQMGMYNMLIGEQQTLIERRREIEQTARDAGRANNAEELLEMQMLSNQYVMYGRMATEAHANAAKALVDLANTMSEAGKPMEDALRQMADATGQAAENMAADMLDLINKNEGYVNSVLIGTPKVMAQMSSMSENAKTALMYIIAANKDYGSSVEETQSLVETQFNRISIEAARLADKYGPAMDALKEANKKIAPSHRESPSPLDIFMGDMGTIENRVAEMVGNTSSSLDGLRGAWFGFMGVLDSVIEKGKEALNAINPWARNSPSLVDNTMTGTSAIVSAWQAFNKTFIPLVMDAHDAMTYLDPSMRHSPSLIDRILAGWDYLTKEEQKAMRRRLASFVNANKQMLNSLQQFYASGRALGVTWSSGMTFDPTAASNAAELVGEHPDWLTARELVALLRQLQIATGSGMSMSDLLGILGVALRDAGAQAAAGDLVDGVDTTGLTGKTRKTRKKQSSGFGDNYADVSMAYGTPVTSASDYLLQAYAERVASSLNSVIGGGSGLVNAITELTSAVRDPFTLDTGSGDVTVNAEFNFDIGNIRSDADIISLVKQVVDAMQKARWRNR